MSRIEYIYVRILISHKFGNNLALKMFKVDIDGFG